jgi:hypothetical protein
MSTSQIRRTVMRKKPSPNPLGYLPIMGIFFISLLYLVGFLQEWQMREYLQQNGFLAEATIVERNEQFRDFSIKYSFTLSGTDVATTRWESTNVFYYSMYLKSADKVSIMYSPTDTKISRIVGNNNFVIGALFGTGGIAASVYSAVILTKVLLKLHKGTCELDESTADK